MRDVIDSLFRRRQRSIAMLRSSRQSSPAEVDSFRTSAPYDAPLVAVTRTGVLESVHRGRVAIVDAEGAIQHSAGDIQERVLMRSVAKPIQALALVLTGAAARYRLTGEELAIVAGSHSGTPEHVRVVRSILAKIGLPEDALKCGLSMPLDEHENHGLMYSGTEPSIVQGDCSGKHAGMLAVCLHCGWSIEDYFDPSHPLQQLNLTLLAMLIGISHQEIVLSVDGCEAPTYYVPLYQIALAYARLVTGHGLPADVQYAAQAIVRSMLAFPTTVAGPGRISTRLMLLGHGKVLVKDGAEATFALGLLDKRLGVAIKISDGGVRAVLPTAATILLSTGGLSPDSVDALQAMARSDLLTHHAHRVGSIESLLRMTGVS